MCGTEESFVALELSTNLISCAVMSDAGPERVEYFSESGLIPQVLIDAVSEDFNARPAISPPGP
jgi:hypothetical protein